MRVLIVEDHEMLRQGLRLLCERQENWIVVGETDNCHEAIRLAISEIPDVVLLDLVLTDGSSLECLPHLCAAFAGGIVVLTAAEDYATHRVARERGADSVVIKGADPQVLFETIEHVVAQKKAASELAA